MEAISTRIISKALSEKLQNDTPWTKIAATFDICPLLLEKECEPHMPSDEEIMVAETIESSPWYDQRKTA